MYSSQIESRDIVLQVYRDIRTVFRLRDIALLVDEPDFQSINRKLNYSVRTGKLLNPRKGIYAKPDYNREELACILYTPSYISMEYVLQKAGVIFQYDTRITAISYLSRTIGVENHSFRYRRVKGEILVNMAGIIRNNNQTNIATAERAFLDTLYLLPDFYFDNFHPLNKENISKLLSIYKSKALSARVTKLIHNV